MNEVALQMELDFELICQPKSLKFAKAKICEKISLLGLSKHLQAQRKTQNLQKMSVCLVSCQTSQAKLENLRKISLLGLSKLLQAQRKTQNLRKITKNCEKLRAKLEGFSKWV